jgi:uroporphyrinogen-III decarboxylase
MTSGSMPLLEMMADAGIDVLVGIDPVQGKGTDMVEMKHRIGDRICLWGGVNGFITVEAGTEDQVGEAVEEAARALGPRGFILSPVDNIRDTSEKTWENIDAMIDAWKNVREY